jgi:hypothetical protein
MCSDMYKSPTDLTDIRVEFEIKKNNRNESGPEMRISLS